MAEEKTLLASTPTTTSPTPQTTTKPKNKTCLVLAIVGAVLFLCVSCSGGIYLLNWLSKNPDVIDTTDSSASLNDYLGFETIDKTIADYQELNDRVESYYSLLLSLATYSENLRTAASNSDPETYFASYEGFNETAAQLISSSKAIATFLENPDSSATGQKSHFLIATSVYAEAEGRKSFWYYVPVIGALVEGSHETVDSARLDLWDYMNNEMTADERRAKLDEYGLASMSSLKKADDETVRDIARDPELHGAINWGKVSAKLADNACVATAEGVFIGKVPTDPALFTAKYGTVKASVSEYVDWVKEQANPKSTTILISQDVKNAVDKYFKDKAEQEWTDLKAQTMREVAEEMRKIQDPVVVAKQVEGAADGNTLSVPEGKWDMVNATTQSVTVEVLDIEVSEDQETTVEIPYADYFVDPEIAKYLGFNAVITKDGDVVSGEDVVIFDNFDISDDVADYTNACEVDYDILSLWDQGEVDSCKDALTSCNQNPNTIGDGAGYATCISAGGGCWDIPRWAWLEDPANCEGWQTRYSGQDLIDATAYCSCIDACKSQFMQQRDCQAEYIACCEKITTN